MENRLFDRHNYSSKTIENYEIMSAYFVDIFYNHLYTEAKKLKVNGAVGSITEGYKHTLNAFLKGLTNPNLYKKSIIGIHHYFITIGFASISFSACIDKLTKEFIPTDYFNSLTSTQKMGVFRMVINQSVKNFIKKIVDEHMVKIIDHHQEKDNVRLLQDDFIDCLILEREGMYQRFIATQTKTNKNETVNRLLAEKMQNEIKRLVKEKYEQQKQLVYLKKAYLSKKESENKLNELVNELKGQISSLQSKQSAPVTEKESFTGTYGKFNNLVQPKNSPQPSSDDEDYPRAKSYKSDSDEPDDKKEVYTTVKPQSFNFQPVKPQTVNRPSVTNTPSIKPQLVKSQSANNQLVKSQSANDQPVKPQSTTNKSVISVDVESEEESNFIEVNSENIVKVLQGDNEILENLKDSDLFNINMDSGTTLDDFA